MLQSFWVILKLQPGDGSMHSDFGEMWMDLETVIQVREVRKKKYRILMHICGI